MTSHERAALDHLIDNGTYVVEDKPACLEALQQAYTGDTLALVALAEHLLDELAESRGRNRAARHLSMDTATPALDEWDGAR